MNQSTTEKGFIFSSLLNQIRTEINLSRTRDFEKPEKKQYKLQ